MLFGYIFRILDSGDFFADPEFLFKLVLNSICVIVSFLKVEV